MKNELILGLDIGSSSVRGALFDLSGQMLEESFVKNERPLLSAVEFDADEALGRIIDIIDQVLKTASGIDSGITHIASCTIWHSLLGVDAARHPTTNVLTWADTRSGKLTGELRSSLDEARIHNRTGARFHSSFWPAKLLWIRDQHPAVWKRTAQWLSVGDYLQSRLCGGDFTSISMASATGLFDQRKQAWDGELLYHLRLKVNSLPLIHGGREGFALTPKFHDRWPLLKDAKWLPSIGDGAANNIGSRCIARNKAALMVGTSGAMRVAFEGDPPEQLPDGLWCYRVDQKRVIVGGALSDGGGLYALLKKDLQVDLADEEIAEEMSRRGADAHGLTVTPFFFGERSTGYHENATGSILGLNPSHDAIDILQAAMESVAFRFAEILDQLEKVSRIDEIVVSGGAIDASPVWTQIVADVLGRDLLVSNEPEASLRGAVLLALESLGKIESIDSFSNEKSRLAFHPKRHEIYKKARKRHISAYEILIAANI
ncbi:MAG: gluconokinase [Pyrinomonadaceae bacterium]